MRLSPTLATIDNLNQEALVMFLPKNPLPTQGLLGLVDWRLCFKISNLLLKNKISENHLPTLVADFKRLKVGKLFIFHHSDSLHSASALDNQICSMLKIISNAQITNFVLSFPDEYPWIFEHWKNNYEGHSVFKNIFIFEPLRKDLLIL